MNEGIRTLYKITFGKEINYAYSDEEKQAVMKKLGFDEKDAEEIEETEPEETGTEDSTEETEEKAVKKSNKKPSIQRYKGLGEMNSDELWETTMDRKTRTLKIVSVHEAEEADRVFEMLMGSEVGPRKSFIQTHARSATLDI